MRDRNVSEADVESALTHRVAEGPDSRPNCWWIRGLDASGVPLQVILNEHQDVVTVYR